MADIVRNGIKYKINGKKVSVQGFENFDYPDVIIPEMIQGKPVTSIDSYAFANTKIKTVCLPESLETIWGFAFTGCTELLEVFFIKSANKQKAPCLRISHYAFLGCSKLNRVCGFNQSASIGEYCFSSCYNLEKVTLNIAEMDSHAFSHTKVKDLTFVHNIVLMKNCLNDSNIERLKFMGDGLLKESVLKHIKDNGLHILCDKNSNLADFVYEGYNVSLLGKI